MHVTAVRPAWAYYALGLLFTLATFSIGLAPYATAPTPGRVTGVLFSPAADRSTGVNTVMRAESGVRIVDVRLGGRLVFVLYTKPDFPLQVARLGAVHTFDAVAAGCHGAVAATLTTSRDR